MNTTRTGPQAKTGQAPRNPTLSPIAVAAGAAPSRANPRGQLDLAPDLAEVRLIDGKTAAQAGSVSLSWWHERVAEGAAPQPVFRGSRFTRWRAVEVAAFWQNYRPAEDGRSIAAQAAKASAAALAVRKARAAEPSSS